MKGGHTEPHRCGDSSDSETSNARSPPSPLLVHSSSEDEKPPTKSPRLQTSSHGAKGRGAYALQLHQLTPELQDLLARSRAFFTKPHFLQRPGRPVTTSTYSKAQERILYKSPRLPEFTLWKAPHLASRTGEGVIISKLIFNCPLFLSLAGYLGFIQRHLWRQPTLAVVERADFMEEYLDFLFLVLIVQNVVVTHFNDQIASRTGVFFLVFLKLTEASEARVTR